MEPLIFWVRDSEQGVWKTIFIKYIVIQSFSQLKILMLLILMGDWCSLRNDTNHLK